MEITYGNQEIVRFMYDVVDKKLVLTVKQEILEDGVLKDHIMPSIVARNEDFEPLLERLLPVTDGARNKIETEAKKILQESWEKKKDQRKNGKANKEMV